MTTKYCFPDDLEALKSKILKVIDPIRGISDKTIFEKDLLFNSERTNAGRSLPEYYLCFFLFADLLGFENLGKSDKTAWSVPIDYNGEAFLIEHRKMGVGVFARNAEYQEDAAAEIVKRINKAVRVAQPYFEWKASEAARQSQLNVNNHHLRLFERLQYFLNLHKETVRAAEERSHERIVEETDNGTCISFPAFELRRNAKWLALSALDSFFSWTEHIFIHLAILNGKVITGEDVADLACNDWAKKFKKAIDIDRKENKAFYDELVIVKIQLRNYMAHGAFGKKGEAFTFHSSAGAVPLLLPHQKGNRRFSFYGDLGFNEEQVVQLIERFIIHVWSGEREPAKLYIESGLPLILTMAKDGSYRAAMKSIEEMEELVDYLNWQFDQAADMDW